MDEVRVRFAPSPTGTLHIGGARTALFNWLFARHNGGKFVLRLEDTDTTRSTEVSADGIIEGLKWLGLDWDEGPDGKGSFGPYRQSERLEIYQHYIDALIESGQAYYCFCSADEIKMEREKAYQEKKDYKYPGTCRSLSPAQVKEKLEQGLKPVIRLKVPSTGITVVHDLVRGKVEFDNALLDDFIIVKSDGWPTYNFAVVIDDYSMKISHVIRAEEHLSNTPKQIMVYNALGLPYPEFAHVSMILAPDRSKLSKRHGATSVQEFRDEGYLPEALVNYLALLGWSPGIEQDIFNLETMVGLFDLKNVSRSAAIYDITKLAWMNGHYLTQANMESVFPLIKNKARELGWLTDENTAYFKKVVDLVRSRAKTVMDIFNEIEYFFNSVETYDEKGLNKHFLKPEAVNKLDAVLNSISTVSAFTAPDLEKAIRDRAADMNIKAAELIHPTRLAISGRTNTPGLFEVMELLGRDCCIERIKRAQEYIEQKKSQ